MSLEELERQFKEKLAGIYDAEELDKERFAEVETIQNQIAEKYAELSDEELLNKKQEFEEVKDEMVKNNNLKLINNRVTLPLSLEVLMTSVTREQVLRNEKKNEFPIGPQTGLIVDEYKGVIEQYKNASLEEIELIAKEHAMEPDQEEISLEVYGAFQELMTRKFKEMSDEELEAKEKELREIFNRLREEGKLEHNGGLVYMPINYQIESNALMRVIEERHMPDDVRKLIERVEKMDNGKVLKANISTEEEKNNMFDELAQHEEATDEHQKVA